VTQVVGNARHCSVGALEQFLDECATEVSRRAALDPSQRTVLLDGAERFRDSVDSVTSRHARTDPARTHAARTHAARTDVPLTAQLDRLASGPLVASLLTARHELTWIPSTRASDGGTERALSPLNDVCDLGDVTAGLMLIGARADYPEHAHPPNEIYLPISGSGVWRHGGDEGYRLLDDTELVYNPPHGIHGARAGAEPLVALYVLWN